MLTLDQLLDGLRAETLDFEAVQDWIAAHYIYTPTAFRNGTLENPAGTNEGSCRLFAFAQDRQLDADTTLCCFGRHYRHVLTDPAGQDHGNIRQFMQHGWAGIRYAGNALQRKA